MSSSFKLVVNHSLLKQLKSCAHRGRRLDMQRLVLPKKFLHQSFRRKRFSSWSDGKMVQAMHKDMATALYFIGVVGVTTALSFASVTLTESASHLEETVRPEQLVAQWYQNSQFETERLLEQTESLKSWAQTVMNEFLETNGLKAYFPDIFVDTDIDESAQVDTDAIPRFPSLAAHVVNANGDLEEFQINSRSGIPIETDLFVGKMILVLVPSEGDPVYEDTFLSNNIRFQLQLQGRFKRLPKGTVYCGAEITERPNLDPVSKGLCNVLLQLLRSIGGNMHYSFGDQEEMPHIAFPAWTAMDHVVVTRGEEVPPKLGEPFCHENAANTKDCLVANWNTDDTYSMSFSSARVDLPTWRMVNLGVLQDTNLESYWGKSMLRLVLYENSGHGKHITEKNNYLMELQMKHLGNSSNAETPATDSAPRRYETSVL